MSSEVGNINTYFFFFSSVIEKGLDAKQMAAMLFKRDEECVFS